MPEPTYRNLVADTIDGAGWRDLSEAPGLGIDLDYDDVAEHTAPGQGPPDPVG